jgi:hypothetical protein
MKKKDQDSSEVLRRLWGEYYRGVVDSVSTLDNSKGLRDYYVELLRGSADQIEANGRQEAVLKAALAEAATELTTKMTKVEAMLLGEETAFYTKYNKVMPEEIRVGLRQRAWESLETE